MSRPKKSDKAENPEEKSGDAPWAIEVEFFGKPSFMTAISEIKVTKSSVSIVKDDGTEVEYSREHVRKVLIMHTKTP